MGGLPDNRDHEVGANRRPDLTTDGVLAAAIKAAEAQVLFDPFKEQFDLPALAIEFGNHCGRQIHLVGEQDQVHLIFDVINPNAAQWLRVGSTRPIAGQADDLIAAQAGAFIHWPTPHHTKSHVPETPDHEQCPRRLQLVEADKIQIAAIHNVEGAGHGRNLVEHLAVGKVRLGDGGPGRQITL